MARSRRVAKKPTKDIPGSVTPDPNVLMTFAERNLRWIGIGAAAVVVILVGLVIWRYLEAKQERQASEALYRALTQYEQVLREKKPLDESLLAFQTVMKDYGGTQSASISAFYAGNCFFAQEKFDEAIGLYELFLAAMPEKSHLHVLAYDSLGYCYEQKQDYQKAVDYFLKTIADPPGLGEVGYLNIARCYEALGNKEKSAEFYIRAVSEYPESPRVSFIQEKIKALEIKPLSAEEQLPTEVVTETSEKPVKP
ncbi:MAG TPA: tetratricopeptide repeat protein [Thermodesulfobacteriota bacterium]|nr:tetratricopeptide repeat protein [Deltaproteobacteria bacterium]HNR14434.1 tetratricopeptide repeat protein [Thermodesulfobacteriota bacterium]HNU71999.1 tetratricopeptide repeat protein [Thermodesulfobacteriota bacterium]